MKKRTKICKNCQDEFYPYTSLMKFCTKSECMKIFIQKTKEKEWSERKSKLKKELLTVQDYLKLAQQVFNQYIRKRDEGKNCISCGKPPKKENAGHYFNANNHWNVRFDELNVHLQCEACNTYLSGNLIEYGINLEKLIGADEFIILREKAYQTRKFTRDELKEIIIIYKNKLKE